MFTSGPEIRAKVFDFHLYWKLDCLPLVLWIARNMSQYDTWEMGPLSSTSFLSYAYHLKDFKFKEERWASKSDIPIEKMHQIN